MEFQILICSTLSNLRRLLPVLCGGLILCGSSGCKPRSTAVEFSEGPFVSDVKESPLLAEKVRAGLLPPLEERLPVRPLVAPVFGPNSLYGGTLRIIVSGYWSYGGLDNVFSSRLLLRLPEIGEDGHPVLDEEGKIKFRLTGNLVESWEYSNDGTTITMKLREGLRYSDGHLFTTEDIAYRFAIWNDTENYRSISPSPIIRIGENPVRLEVIDKWTFRFILPEPDFSWLETAATQLQFWEAPKHWLGRYDPNINPEVQDWTDFKRHFGSAASLERPVLGPWKLVKWEEASDIVAERNPYFYMVDPDGRQLPYIDRVQGFVIKNPEVATMRVMSGAIDLYDEGQVQDLAILKAGEERAGYRFFFVGEGPGSFPALLLNMLSDRPGLAELMQNREFRRALSLGINREEINDLVFSGFGTPSNVSLGSWFTQMYADYDPESAKELLSGLNLIDRDGDGLLEYPDGSDVTIVVTTIAGPYANVVELVVSHWKKLGINAVVQNVHPLQYSVLRRNREFDVIAAHNGSFDVRKLTRLQNWSPFSELLSLDRAEGRGLFEPFQRFYLSGGLQGQDPGPEIMDPLVRLRELEIAWRNEQDESKRLEIVRQISEIWANEIFMIGTVGRVPSPLIVSKRLLNVPPVFEASPEGIWLRSSLYPFQLVIHPEAR